VFCENTDTEEDIRATQLSPIRNTAKYLLKTNIKARHFPSPTTVSTFNPSNGSHSIRPFFYHKNQTNNERLFEM